MKAKTFDSKFDSGGKIVNQLDLRKARRIGTDAKRVNVDFPAWMVDSLDREARRLGVTRQSLIKLWLADKLAQPGCRIQALTEAARNAGSPRRWRQLTKPSNLRDNEENDSKQTNLNCHPTTSGCSHLSEGVSLGVSEPMRDQKSL